MAFNRSNSFIVGYAIGGTGSVTKLGAGTLILTGANTYAGPTTITAGKLQIGNGGTTGSIDNTSGVTNNAELVYNRGDSLSVGYAIGGTGSLTKLGAGTLTLSGANTYAGDTTVNDGTLSLAGSNAQLNFVIGAAGVNNKITGAGTLLLAGDFNFDLAAASTTLNDWWQIVDVGTLVETFEDTFSVLGFKPHAGGVLWTKAILSTLNAYEFSESTGILRVTNASLPGDTNGDFVVDAADFINLKKNFNKPGAGVEQGNFTGTDGFVDWADLSVLMNNMGVPGPTTTAPEPATLGLLAIGALAMLRRRRK